MRKAAMIMMFAAVIAMVVPASAELQNVQVGGSIRIRADYYSNYTPDNNVPGALTGNQIIWPNFFLPNRPIGSGAFNGNGITSAFSWNDSDSNSTSFVEQRTRLNVKADFTNEVSAFIELDSYDIWGEDFRSNYVTGADGRAVSVDDVEVYQAYIEAREMWGLPLTMRVGRQEVALGSQWLVGVNDTAAFFQGQSFDGLTLVYSTDVFSVTGWAMTLREGGINEEDEDDALYGIYGSYKGLENITIDAYWIWARLAGSVNDTNFIAPIEWLEDLFNLDDYDVTNLHTVGLRGAGTIGAFDFESEVAYQFGNADGVGAAFRPFLYGDDGAEFSNWAGNLELGYTFDIAWSPRVYLGGAYFGGEDNRSISFLQWLNPFDKPDASVSFNRLFSNWEYSEFIENTDLSNAYVIRGGVSVHPTESIEALLSVSYFKTLDEFSEPINWSVGGFKIPIAPALSFLDSENDDYLGTEVELIVTYHYSEDLSFQAGWAHLFVGGGLEDGQFSAGNGLAFNGGNGDDDSDYLFVETKLCF